ncbi:MAG: methanogenesis marker protein Mmp4/MtxX [Methanobacteriaceae archaeon]|nr:methanogenesis marker protein Mmp4/MtxX [Methanobacteriaceae archaeon]
MTIAIGVGENPLVDKAIKKIDFEVIRVESEDQLVDLLIKGHVDAVVRGSLSASKIMNKIKDSFPKPIYRASFLEIDHHKFLLAPVGIDEGDSISDKVRIIEKSSEFLKNIGITPKIAVISGGRSQDIGRSKKIDKSILEGREVVRITKDKYPVKHYYILIEDAIKDGCNLILAPDGISGNLIFRTLVFLGSGISYGAVTLGLDKIFIDTSRSQSFEGFVRALKFANFLVELKSGNKHVNFNSNL